ncbi:sulfite exporter TauE/SafE family protein [Cupriavidus sp. 30B13]|uniref:sulfite exporter TauE/SafE family protein n=1 Tax=Cupriavidus sp. 30B13 TaxID=3384241 RepID=UPI003B8FFAE7
MDFPLLIVALGAVVAGFVQGLSGFAFGMVAMSFWVWTVEPRLAAAMAVFGSLTGQVVAALTVRRGFSPRQLLPFVAGGVAGIPIGVALLPMLDANLFKACLGAFLVVWCPLMLLSAQLPRVRIGGRLADGLAGTAGGIMGGIGGFSGVIPTLWCTLRGLPKDEQRAIIQNFNLATLAVTMATYVGTGIVTRDMVPMFLVVGPAMLVPSILGARLYIGISEIAFRRIVLSLLTASGVVLLCASLPRLLAAAH